jgi:hypothetical protein
MIGIFLNEFGREAEFSEAMKGFRTESIFAQAAGWNSYIPEERRDVGEVGGRSAQLRSGGQQVPQQFAETDDNEFLTQQGSFSVSFSAMARGCRNEETGGESGHACRDRSIRQNLASKSGEGKGDNRYVLYHASQKLGEAVRGAAGFGFTG